MRNNFFKCAFATALLLVVISSNSFAQSGYGGGTPSKTSTKSKAKAGAKKGAAKSSTSGSGYGSTPTANQNAGYGSTPASDNSSSSGYGSPSGGNSVASSTKPTNLPIVFKPNSGGGIGDSVKQSLRVDNAIDKQLIKERRPLEYERIREDDAVYSQRICCLLYTSPSPRDS